MSSASDKALITTVRRTLPEVTSLQATLRIAGGGCAAAAEEDADPLDPLGLEAGALLTRWPTVAACSADDEQPNVRWP